MSESDLALPDRIGRYRIDEELGTGSSGTVYRARDESLDRGVALKVLHRHLLESGKALETFFAEARILAQLDHPVIVPVYDVGKTDDGMCYLVAKLVEGTDLRARLKQSRLSRTESVELIARVADALHYAHRRKLIHRDVKPGNVLLDTEGNPVLGDFGLALREENFGKGPTFVGTVPYMSPEQARRESHRVDARTDIYSLGVIFYELLVGHRPFLSESKTELLEMIRTQEAPPPRAIDPTLDPELERIVLKALANRISDRYATAQDFADDLRHWQQSARRAAPAQSTPVPVKTGLRASMVRMVPRGLRSYGKEDADYFLDLVPGPRNREGLPDRVAFWKDRLESIDPEQAFRVGLLYGPSGCGKSSLVKAGLLPRLASHVRTLFIEATPDQTEEGLLRALRSRFAALPPDASLADSLLALRRGRGLASGEKVVIVIDQFEQWLHTEHEGRSLVEALRQCDGARVQCLLLVRDDFWLAISRFLHELEVPLVEGQNAALVDRFDAVHARKVLAEYGRSLERLPDNLAECSADQKLFLDRAIAGLAEHGTLVPVRLALFAEMVKRRPWTPATLRAVGGAEGVGVAFLEETFSAATAPPVYHRHELAARGFLQALLPEPDSDLKGQRTREELLQASGYGDNPAAFDELVGILDPQLRLISLADVAGLTTDSVKPTGASQERVVRYQLTHDYLVPAVREWTQRRLQTTRRGRAELRLEERAKAWNARPEQRQLPSWIEWVSIGLFTPARRWTPPQAKMMRAATRAHGMRTLAWSAAMLLLAGTAFLTYRHFDNQSKDSRADVLIAWIKQPPSDQRAQHIAELEPFRPWVVPKLAAIIADPTSTQEERVHARLLLVHFKPDELPILKDDLRTAGPQDVVEIRRLLEPTKDIIVPELWREIEDPHTQGPVFLRLAGAMAGLDPTNAPRWEKIRERLDEELVKLNTLLLPDWLEVFRPVRDDILTALKKHALEGDRRDLAADILAEFAGEYIEFLPRVIAQLDHRQALRVWPILAAHGPRAINGAEAELKRPIPDEDANQIARRHARLGIALLKLGAGDRLWPMLRESPEPRVRSYLVHFFAPLEVDPVLLFERYTREPDVSARRALLWSLGEYPLARFPVAQRPALLERLQEDYRDDPDSGVHSALEWLLRRWDAGPKPLMASSNPSHRWFTNPAGDTLATLTRDRRSFAIATKEVTVEQFQKLMPDTERLQDLSAVPQGPVLGVSWYEAARYCRRLSEREGIPEDQMCYPPFSEIRAGMKLPENYLDRTGYRLPTEAEWEFACRAGTTTKRYYGDADDLLLNYGWFARNAKEKAHQPGLLKPNDFGLFDMLGNAVEWCDDWYFPDPMKQPSAETLARYREEYRAKVLRGGELSSGLNELGAAKRFWEPADHRNHHLTGFRVARTRR